MNDAVAGNSASHGKMKDYFFTGDRIRVEVVRAVRHLVYENLKVEVS